MIIITTITLSISSLFKWYPQPDSVLNPNCINPNDVLNIVFIRCDRSGGNGPIRLAAVRCPNSLAFDIDNQVCDWKLKVNNCDLLEREY